jgi:hypothetical protein
VEESANRERWLGGPIVRLADFMAIDIDDAIVVDHAEINIDSEGGEHGRGGLEGGAKESGLVWIERAALGIYVHRLPSAGLDFFGGFVRVRIAGPAFDAPVLQGDGAAGLGGDVHVRLVAARITVADADDLAGAAQEEVDVVIRDGHDAPA